MAPAIHFVHTQYHVLISHYGGKKKGLQYTSSGYGSKIPTQYMVQWEGKWRRVYCKIYSNIGTLYIGKIEQGLIVQIED